MRGLLLAEKPSVMRAIEAVYKAGKYPDTLDFGAFHGHLMELKQPEDYSAAWADRMDTSVLPMIPKKFEYMPADPDSVDKLMDKINKGNYDYLINACDAGREGEHIFWSFYESNGLKLPVKRFWASSVTKPALEKALKDLKDPKLYEGMRQASKYRAQFDWLVGMNFTRAAGASLHRFCPIGRVQSPVLKLIVERERAIQNFKPETFYEVKGQFTINGSDPIEFIHLIGKSKETRFTDKAEADKVVAAVNGQTGTVAGVKEEIKETDAPTLYSLAELQKDANKYLKFKPDHTLEVAQQLYEAGFLSYPRSESRFLPTDMIQEIPAHIASIAAVPGLSAYASKIGKTEIDAMLKKSYVNDAGITDHHAIIPTDTAPAFASLTKDQQKLYELVCKSFLAIFMPPYKTANTIILAAFKGNYLFRASGKVELDKGYSVLYSCQGKDVPLPKCKKGDPVIVNTVKAVGSQTKPPQRYSPRTILAAMQNAGQDLPDSAMRSILKESAGLGTSATRAAILKKLEDRELVKVEKNAYYALDKGMDIIDAVGDRDFCSPLLTGQWEEKLRSIEDGNFKGDFNADMESYIKTETAYLLGNLKSAIRPVGTCPSCGGQIIALPKSYICEHYKKDDPNSCKVGFPKQVGGYVFTEDDIRTLLSQKETDEKTVKTKSGDRKATFVLNLEGGLTPSFAKAPEVGKCPFCGGAIREYNKGYCCDNSKKGDPNSCKTVIWKTNGGYSMTEEDLGLLLAGKETSPHTVKTKNGEWEVKFVLDKNEGLKYISAAPSVEKTPVGKCPFCGGQVMESKVFCCENNIKDDPNSCRVFFAKAYGGYKFTKEDIAVLLSGAATDLKPVATKKGPANVAFRLDKTQGITFTYENKAVGSCPCCGKPVVERSKAYVCEGNKKDDPDSCPVVIWKTYGGYTLTEADLRVLLQGKETDSHTVKKKNGDNWEVKFVIRPEKGVTLINAEDRQVFGKCPSCGNTAYITENNMYCCDKSCNWSFPRTIKGVRLTDQDMKALIEGRKTRMIKGFSWNSGSTGSAKLYLDSAQKLKWEFAVSHTS